MNKVLLTLLLVVTFMSSTFAQHMRMTNQDRRWEYTGVILKENVYSITDKGAYSIVNSYLSFQSDNPNEFNADTQIELYAHFKLPESYEITNLWLWVGDDIMEARMYDRWTAERIYEGIVNRRKDPAILYKNNNGWYELRIYPFKPDEIRKIRISYLVPNNLNANGKSTPLPDQIQRLATVDNADPGFVIFTDLEADAWSISGETNPIFEAGSLSGEPFLSTTLPSNGYPQSYTLTKTANIDSIEVRSFQDGEDKYYDISVLPFQLIDNDFDQKVLVLIDYEEANTSISQGNLLETIKQQLQNYLTEKDQFNILFSGLNTVYLSEEWIDGSATKIDSVFSGLNDRVELGFSNLDNLLTNAYDVASGANGEVSVLLVSSTQNYSSISSANSLLEALESYSGGNFPRTYISDIQTENLNYEWRNGRYYIGNEYLYLNLSRETAGELYNRNDYSDVYSRINSSFEAINGSIIDLEVYPIINNGFSFSRYASTDENSSLTNSAFYQIGKYTGAAPFTLQISGFYQDQVFSKQIVVDQEDITESDSTLTKIWVGQKIKQLESSNPTNEIIEEIIELSLKHRVLSRYTSFLALEPSDTVFACSSCVDESALVSLEEESVPESFAVDSLSAYPNPFNPSVNINVQVQEVWDATNSSLEIYSIIGQKVASINTAQFSGLKNFQVVWDVSNSSSIATGVYLVVLRTPTAVNTMKITYLK